MSDAAGQMADRFHFLSLPQRLLCLSPLSQLHRFGHDGDDDTVRVTHRTHLKIEPSPTAGRQVHMDLLAHNFASRNDRDRRAHTFGHAGCTGEPRCLPERFADYVFKRGFDSGQRRGIRIEHRTVGRHQAHVGVARFKNRSQACFFGLQLGRALRDLDLERLVESSGRLFGLAGAEPPVRGWRGRGQAIRARRTA